DIAISQHVAQIVESAGIIGVRLENGAECFLRFVICFFVLVERSAHKDDRLLLLGGGGKHAGGVERRKRIMIALRFFLHFGDVDQDLHVLIGIRQGAQLGESLIVFAERGEQRSMLGLNILIATVLFQRGVGGGAGAFEIL